MRILLTGASGFTGRHFQDYATQAGHAVVPLACNLTDPASLQQAVQAAGPVDAVVHLAAISFVGHANDAEFYAVNTVGTSHLLAALAAQATGDRPQKVLVASSANVYGNCQNSPIAETQPPAPVNHYAASKLAMEHIAMTFQDRLPVVITRPFNYTGPGQAKSFLIPKLVDHFVRKAPVIELGNLHVEREFNDVRLVSDAYLRLLDKGVTGEIYNVCTGKTYSLMDVVGILTRSTGHSIEVKVNPAFVRTNEVHRLCGDPKKLVACIGELQEYTLEKSLPVY
jgi:nucleoside-diphosphate-sugar epimerase